jgi:hypothetical protein
MAAGRGESEATRMVSSGERAVKQAAESRPMRLLGRVGLATYGVVHLLIAYLAVRVATGNAEGKTDKTGALQTLAGTAGGVWPLWIVSVGLAALALWQLSEAALGHRRFQGGRPAARRAVNVGEAVLFGYLAYGAGRIAAGGKSPSDADQSSLVAKVLAQPYGKWLVAVAGIAVLVGAVLLAHHGITRAFTRELDLSPAAPATRDAAVRLGQVGYTALGGVYGIAGLLVVVAALRSDPSRATGLDLALRTLAAQQYGPYLLLLMAAGLAAFGVYALFDARYRAE